MSPAGALAVTASPALSSGARPTASALAVSVALHGAVAAAALWWPFAGPQTSVPVVTVEVAFWPEALGEETTAASAVPPEAPAPEVTKEVEAAREVVPETPPPVQVASVEPMPPAVVEPAPTLVELPPPPAPRPRERVRTAARPVPLERPVEPATPAPAEAAPSVANPALAALPSPHPPAATPAQPAPLQAASEMPALPPLITQARFRSPPVPPAYPRRAIDLGQEGEVLIRALVGPDGESRDIRIFRSSGVAVLDDAALRAVRRWAFEAAQVNGRAIEAWVEVPVRFQLRSVL